MVGVGVAAMFCEVCGTSMSLGCILYTSRGSGGGCLEFVSESNIVSAALSMEESSFLFFLAYRVLP